MLIEPMLRDIWDFDYNKTYKLVILNILMEILIRSKYQGRVKVENSLGGSCDFENPRSSVPYILDSLESTRDNQRLYKFDCR